MSRTISLRGAAAAAFMSAAKSKVDGKPATPDEEYAQIATFVHMHVKTGDMARAAALLFKLETGGRGAAMGMIHGPRPVSLLDVAVKKPGTAYAVVDLPGGWGVGCCVEGEKGYHPVPDYGPYDDDDRAQGIVDRLNKRLGLDSVAVRRIVGSTMPTTPAAAVPSPPPAKTRRARRPRA